MGGDISSSRGKSEWEEVAVPYRGLCGKQILLGYSKSQKCDRPSVLSASRARGRKVTKDGKTIWVAGGTRSLAKRSALAGCLRERGARRGEGTRSGQDKTRGGGGGAHYWWDHIGREGRT